MRAKPSESPPRILFLSLGCTNCCSKIRAYWTKVHQIFKSAITEFQRKECWCQFSTTISSGFCTPIDSWLSQWTVDVFIETQRSVVFFSRGHRHTMDVLSPFISVICHSDWLFYGESCPRLDVVHPGRAWPSSPACTWHCSLHYLILQATPLFPHKVTIVC